MKGAMSRTVCVISILMLFSVSLSGASRAATDQSIYRDDAEDVISDLKKGPLTRLQDLHDLEGEEAEDFAERPNVDIASLTIIQNDTYISFIVTVEGDLQMDRNYTYSICGYRSAKPDRSDTFDFIIEYSGGDSSYSVWEEGEYVEKGNVSLAKVARNSLNITMNRSRFVLGSREDPFLVCAITILYLGEGKQRYIDIVMTENLDDDMPDAFDETTWIIAQVAFIGFLIIGFMIIWNVWAKKKGMEDKGGVCPKCEYRLDKGIDFCPHCGTYIRGPEADKENPRPRIVHPLDSEE